MLIKQLMLGSVFALASFSMVQADESSKVDTSDFYVGAYGGANWGDVIEHPIVDVGTGVVIGGVVGTHIEAVPGLRVEADLSYRQQDVDVFGVINVNDETWGLLGNVVYDVPVNLGPVHPYVLAGVGYANHTATFESISLLELSNGGVAWQLGTGINTEVAKGVTMGLGYRYFQGPELSVLGTELSDGTNHSVVATINFAIN